MKKIGSFLLFILTVLSATAQQYTVNGNATKDNCRCYTLTPALNFQSGSVWNNNRINLSQSFDFSFDVKLGCQDANGADGMVFVLQPISTSVGSTGGGLGFQGISPSVGVTLDTYQNTTPDNDPTYDHIGIQINGDIVHTGVNNLAGPLRIADNTDDVEDCKWHVLRVSWDAVTFRYETYFDGVPRLSIVKDLVTDVFGGNPLVFWGFTGSTGGLNNQQQFCTSLTPRFKSLAGQKRCLNEPITFTDSTASFGPVLKRYWNFGDGSPIDSVNINPVHIYSVPGDYTVTFTVIGADGCSEGHIQSLRIGSKPVAGFTYNDSCVLNQIQFTDTSRAAVGTIGQWHWDFGNGSTANVKNPITSYNSFGLKTIRLVVKSIEGCESDTLVQPIRIRGRPVVDFTFTDSVCLGSPTIFTDQTVSLDGPVTAWAWTIDGVQFGTQNLSYTFTTPGSHNVLHIASLTGSNGCIGVAGKIVFVVAKPVAAAKTIFPCLLTPVTLQDSSYTTDGTPVTQWWWNLGGGLTSVQQNPAAVFNTTGNNTVQLVAKNSSGCVSDTLTKIIEVKPKPTAMPGLSSPLCAGKPHLFLDSSVVAGAAVNGWLWLFDNGDTSNQQNVSKLFSAGAHTVKLIVRSNDGCKSDTAYRTYVTHPKPTVAMSFNDGCVKDTVLFSGSTFDNINAWVWNYGDGVTGSTQNTKYVYAIPGSYPVSLFGISTAGCASDTVKKPLNIYQTDAFAGNNVVAAMGQPVQLQAGGGTFYQWSPAEGLDKTNISNPVAVSDRDITYTVRVSAPTGCASTATVTVARYKGPDIYVPNAFTPNGDGSNDNFRAFPVGISKFESLTVFNRYGEKIFFTSNAILGWDGTWQGKKQPQGSYVWMVSGTDYKGVPVFKKGAVLLIR